MLIGSPFTTQLVRPFILPDIYIRWMRLRFTRVFSRRCVPYFISSPQHKEATMNFRPFLAGMGLVLEGLTILVLAWRELPLE
jgi:hypothetical protein